MRKTKRSHKIIAVFLTINFLTTLVPLNRLFANNNGPTAPEAAAFEPVDATDMVNLLTGDMSYVIPLLNVPGPEGGYPLSMSYHSGIAMDQEASWIGLGWNLNPGAITRSVNGYPDDWNDGTVMEYFHDEGEETVYGFSVGYDNGAMSIGINTSWGSNRAFGGSVSLGFSAAVTEVVDEAVKTLGVGSVSITMGTDGMSIGAGYGNKLFSGKLKIGNKGVGLNASLGQKDSNNKLGLNFSSTFEGETSYGATFSSSNTKGTSMSVGLSSEGASFQISSRNKKGWGGGTKMNFQFHQSISANDYDIHRTGWRIPIIIPTPVGTFNVSFSKQKIRYELNKEAPEQVYGPLYMGEIHTLSERQEARLVAPPFYTGDWFTIEDPASLPSPPAGMAYEYQTVTNEDKMMDMYEIDATRNYYGSTDLRENNPAFPTYDNYTVNAQGLTGNMKPRMLENGALLGLEKDIDDDLGYTLSYETPNTSHFAHGFTEFDRNVHFYFENDYASSLILDPMTFSPTSGVDDIFDYLDSSNVDQVVPRKKGGRFVEAFTNAEMADGTAENSGFMLPALNMDYGNPEKFEQDGIGGFKITTMDGKTYHYGIAVYNHELISRRFGMSDPNKPENENYFEKRQLKKYATHWLLTAVTGPDYIDKNDNKLVDDNDYGYWVRLKYGQWSQAYAWKTPYGKDYEEYNTYLSGGNEYMRYYTWGRKDIYYLDIVETRTHEAFFIKDIREDNIGTEINHTAIRPDEQSYSVHVPTQELLRLDEIVLVKKEAGINPSKSNDSPLVSSGANQTITLHWQEKDVTAKRNWQNKVLDVGDFTEAEKNELYANALKVVDLGSHQNYSLAENSPNSVAANQGRLTLNGVTYKGKENVQVVPGYKFTYANIEGFDNEREDDWGYNKTNPHNWSLSEIRVPYGGKINIEYEPDIFHTTSVINNGNVFDYQSVYLDPNPSFDYVYVAFDIEDKLGIVPGGKVELNYFYECYDVTLPGEDPPTDPIYTWNYAGLATILSVNTETGIALAKSDNEAHCIPAAGETCPTTETPCNGDYNEWATIYSPDGTYYERIGGGVRVKSITTSDEIQSYRTEYTYPKEVTYTIGGQTTTETVSSGVVSYVPHQKDLSKIIPYASELPSPVVMYEFVEVESFGDDDVNVSGKAKYHFQVLHPDNFISIMQADGLPVLTETITVDGDAKNVDIRSHIIKDYITAVGQVLSIENYNSVGQLIGKTVNNYKAVEDIDQGIIQESFQLYKVIDFEEYDTSSSTIHPNTEWIINNSTRISYPSVLESTTVTSGGYSTTTYFDAHDFNTGNLLETRTYDSEGYAMKSQIVPAYTKYPEMGSKVDNISNRNMMSQLAAEYSLVDVSGEWKPLSVGITTWNNEWQYTWYNGQVTSPSAPNEKIWRKHKTFVWDGELNPDGTLLDYNLSTDDGFDWSLGATTQSEPWKQISEITKYDNNSMTLEVRDINGNFMTTKMTDDESKVLLTANAGYGEAFYSGVEYDNLPGTTYVDQQVRGENFRTNEKAHTGSYSAKLGPDDDFGILFKKNTYRPGGYVMSVWVHKDNYQNARFKVGTLGTQTAFNGEKVFAGDWVQMRHYFDRTAAQVAANDKVILVTSANGDIYVDDFRLHPVESVITSYVYNEWDELSFILGPNNLATKYIYDAGGRLIEIHAEAVDSGSFEGGFSLAQDWQYNYKVALEDETDPGGGNGEPGPDPLGSSSLTLYVNDAPTCTGCNSSCGVCEDACELVCQEIESTIGVTGGSGDYRLKFYLKVGVTGSYNLVQDSSSNSYNYTYNIATDPLCEEGANPWIRTKVIITDNQHPELGSLTVESPQRSVNCTLGGNQ